MNPKAIQLVALRAQPSIFQAAYPDGSVRQLIWFDKTGGQDLAYKTMPVVCDGELKHKARKIESGPDFYAWGLNPWTGEKAAIQVDFTSARNLVVA